MPEHAHERTVGTRMRTGLAVDRNSSVRSNHRRRMLEYPLQVLLVDGVEDGEALALLDHPQHRVGRVRHCRLELARARHFAEPLTGERLVPFAGGDLHVGGIAAAALFFDEPDGLTTNPRP